MRAVVITVSTRAAAGVYTDEAGPVVAQRLREAGFDVDDPVLVSDDGELVDGGDNSFDGNENPFE